MIDWVQGSVADAQREAQERDAPLLVLWTANWCPPCNDLRRRVLEDETFRAATGQGVAVRLEADMPLAQFWAERLRAHGYPTLIVFDPSGKELLRLPPSGLPVHRYTELLTTAFRSQRPLSELTSVASAWRLDLNADDVRRLAFHSWGQELVLGAGPQRVGLMRRLRAAIPVEYADESVRLDFWYVLSCARSGENSEQAFALRQFAQSLESEHASFANQYECLVDCRAVLDYLAREDCDLHVQLARRWRGNVERLLVAERLGTTERLIALFAAVQLASVSGTERDALHESARAAALAADRELTDPSDRQSALNMAGYLLWEIGTYSEADALFRSAIERSAAPAYFMQPYARFLRERGDLEGALTWLARATHESAGPATRLTVFSKYLSALIELRGRRASVIEQETTIQLEALRETEGMFCGRCHDALKHMVAILGAWGVQHDQHATVRRIAALLKSVSLSDPIAVSREAGVAAAARLLDSIH